MDLLAGCHFLDMNRVFNALSEGGIGEIKGSPQRLLDPDLANNGQRLCPPLLPEAQQQHRQAEEMIAMEMRDPDCIEFCTNR